MDERWCSKCERWHRAVEGKEGTGKGYCCLDPNDLIPIHGDEPPCKDYQARFPATRRGNSIINALKRLERAGAEDSRATQKLKVACEEAANYVAALVPEGTWLPQRYEVGNHLYCRPGESLAADWRNYLKMWGPPSGTDWVWVEASNLSREDALQFAGDVAGGLLREVAEFLEFRVAEAEKAAAELEAAKVEADAPGLAERQALIDEDRARGEEPTLGWDGEREGRGRA